MTSRYYKLGYEAGYKEGYSAGIAAAKVNEESPSAPEMTVAEVASKYNVSVSTIQRRIKDGTLSAYRLGARSIRFDAAEVARAFNGGA